jgi:hypothetical protein
MDGRDLATLAGDRVDEPGALAARGPIGMERREQATGAGPGHAGGLAEDALEVLDVLGDEPKDDQVEGRVGEGQGVGQPVAEPSDRMALELSAGPVEHLGGAIERVDGRAGLDQR